MNSRDYIPSDALEIEHVLDLLREEFRPDVRKLWHEGKIRVYGVAPRLRQALIDAIAPHVPEWERRDWSDFAHLTATRQYGDWIRAAASAVANLYSLERLADERAVDGIDPEDDKLAWMPEWDRLRAALIEVALSFAIADLIDEEKRARQAQRHAAALAASAEQARVFRRGRKRGALAAHTQCLVDLLIGNPGLTTKEIARLVRERAGDKDWPFDVEGDDDVLRDSGESIKLEDAIDNARKRHVRSDSAR